MRQACLALLACSVQRAGLGRCRDRFAAESVSQGRAHRVELFKRRYPHSSKQMLVRGMFQHSVLVCPLSQRIVHPRLPAFASRLESI